jgi:hypothetical protein
MFKAMASGLTVFLLLHAAGGLQNGQAQTTPRIQSQHLPKCGDQKVVYSAFDDSYGKRIVWHSGKNIEGPPTGLARQYSPQRTKWIAIVEPDTSKPGPWNTTVYFGSDADEIVSKLSLNDNIGSDFKWLNEKLVFGTIWWGRIYATEVILDLESHKYIFREMAHYGSLTQRCE